VQAKPRLLLLLLLLLVVVVVAVRRLMTSDGRVMSARGLLPGCCRCRCRALRVKLYYRIKEAISGRRLVISSSPHSARLTFQLSHLRANAARCRTSPLPSRRSPEISS